MEVYENYCDVVENLNIDENSTLIDNMTYKYFFNNLFIYLYISLITHLKNKQQSTGLNRVSGMVSGNLSWHLVGQPSAGSLVLFEP